MKRVVKEEKPARFLYDTIFATKAKSQEISIDERTFQHCCATEYLESCGVQIQGGR
jgi:hypothetical protein